MQRSIPEDLNKDHADSAPRHSLFVLCILLLLAAGCRNNPVPLQVVVYASVDQIYAEPILRAFESETGMRVLPVYDVEAAKTTGLVQRLLAEQSRPQADVFWNGEFMQTIALKHRGALDAYVSPSRAGIQPAWFDPQGYWTGMGARLRVLLVNTEKRRPGSVPASLDAISGPGAGIAYPLFGTSASHAAALYATLGPETARAWFEHLRSAGVRVVDGNSVVRDLVAAGQLSIGLTDSDDACGAVRKGAPVRIVVPDPTMVIPGTVALVHGAPHPTEARRFIDWLLSSQGERRLIDSGFSQMSVRSGKIETTCPAATINPSQIPLEKIAGEFDRSRKDMEALFVR